MTTNGGRITASFVAMVVLFVLVAGASSCGLLANRARIADSADTQHEIQNSRIYSCRQNYQAFNEVFRPFFPAPEKRTQAQRKSLQKLRNTVKRLKRSCDRQIKPREVRP